MAKRAIKVKIIQKSGDKSLMGERITLEEHSKYLKYVKVCRKYMIHDEDNKHKVGDIVYIQEHKPFSKKKNWIIVEDNKNKKEDK